MNKISWGKSVSVSLLCMLSSTAGAAEGIWSDLANKVKLDKVANVNVLASKYQLISAKTDLLERTLLDRTVNEYDIELPMPDGSLVMFRLTYAPVYAAELEEEYPSIRTFTGYQLDNPQNSGRFDITPHGFHGMFLYNNQRAFIDPMQRGNNSTHLSYYKHDAKAMSRPQYDEVLPSDYTPTKLSEQVKAQFRAGETLKIYRIAVAAAGEYTAFHGGTKELAQAAIVTTINRVNEVYNVDLSVQLNLVGNNDSVIYTDAATDPYQNTSGDLTANEAVMNNTIGTANYDIGHIVNTGGGGLAYLGVVCDETSKWGGVTGSSSPTADPFDIDYVAHEVGHQFGGQHSFNGTAGNCGTRSTNDAYEPGSGATIMAYAGICDEQNLQSNTDAMFHSHSVEQIGAYMASGGTCATTSAINNEAPTVSAGSDYIIPASTPIKLTGSATDPDNDTLSYSWEQFDLGTASSSAATMVDDGFRPLFRTWLPVSTPVRYLPRMSDLLAGTTTIGETYATTNRSMTFKLLARDGKGNTASDTMKVTVDSASGPFTVTAPVSGDTWAHSTNPVVTWNTANTENAPVSCATVDIMLSTDSGATFSTTVKSDTANDGSEAIDVPSLDSSTARLQVMCHGNIFFAVNNGDFTVNGVIPGGIAPIITAQSSLSVNEDASLTVQFTDLTVVDPDTTYPGSFTMALTAGTNYTVNGQVITPDKDYNGTLTVPVKVNDGGLDSNSFDLTVTVNAVNDAPVITAANTVTTDEDTAVTLSTSILTITDVDNTTEQQTLSVMNGSNYTVSGNTVTPAADFNGTLTVPVKVNDGTDDSASFDVMVNVNAVNDAPTITGQSTVSTDEDMAVTLTTAMLTIVDVDSSSEQMILTVMAGSNYTVSGNTVTPAANFNGDLAVMVKVSDGQADSATFSMKVSVNPINDAPMITGQNAVSVNEDTALILTPSMLTIVDADNNIADMTIIVASGENYTVSGSTITPAANFNGNLSVMVRVNDGSADSNNFAMVVGVNSVDDAPVISGSTAQTMDEDSTLTLDKTMLSITDVDTAIDALTMQVLAGDHYTVTGMTITPDANYNGALMVNVTVSDATTTSAVHQMAVTVNAVNDNPVATNDAFTVDEDSTNNSFNLVGNDSDVDGDTVVMDSISYTGAGTATMTSTGITYTPAAKFDGTDTLSYTVSDGNGGTATATVTITVTPKPSSGGSSLPLWLSMALLPLSLIRRRKGK